MEAVPATRYVRSEEVCIAYQVLGEGATDIVYACDPIGPCDLLWDDPIAARGLRRLAKLGRLVLYDIRGVGASSPTFGARTPPLQAWVDDLLRLLDEVGSRRAVIISPNLYAPLALMFAAAHPNRTASIVGIDAFARFVQGDDYPHGIAPDLLDSFVDGVTGAWGTPELASMLVPSRARNPSFLRWSARAQRLGMSPSSITRIMPEFLRSDLRPALPSIRVPVLLIAHRDNPVIGAGHSHHLRDNLPDARLVELDGSDYVWFSADAEELIDHVEAFVNGSVVRPATSRVLSTVLFTDIVDSTARAQQLGDGEWSGTLSRHDEIVRNHVESYQGRFVKSTGDGALATFDAPARALLCADGIRTALAAMDIRVRIGLHTCEIETSSDDISGLGVHIASRIAGLAGADEVLVSSTVPALVMGSSLSFDDHGEHRLKGIDQPWKVLRLAAT